MKIIFNSDNNIQKPRYYVYVSSGDRICGIICMVEIYSHISTLSVKNRFRHIDILASIYCSDKSDLICKLTRIAGCYCATHSSWICSPKYLCVYIYVFLKSNNAHNIRKKIRYLNGLIVNVEGAENYEY